ncbi:M7GpppX diphosphatase [Aphelenchoides fujianensis]|nr:M7GpppX diphosphatase [Aphelenchoides fujianensis]
MASSSSSASPVEADEQLVWEKKFGCKAFFWETAADYAAVHRALIREQLGEEGREWVQRILSVEPHRLVFHPHNEELTFRLMRDKKMIRSTKRVHYLGLPMRGDLQTMRDLNVSHLPLLEHMLERGPKFVAELEGVDEAKLRVYFHYPPSQYHLHVHFSTRIDTKRSTLLSEVIANIRMKPDFYQRVQVHCFLFKNHPLFHVYSRAGVIKEKQKGDWGMRSKKRQSSSEEHETLD